MGRHAFKSITSHNVHYKAQGSYCISPAAHFPLRHVWFVLHGYGQLAQDFIQPFLAQQPEDTCIVAPQGQSLFYLRRFSGEVGASWLTAHDRESGIKNQLHYLDAVYEEVMGGLSVEPDVYLLGFSQGAATASRWASRASFPFKALVLWAGYPDHEIPAHVVEERLKRPRVVVVHGTRDHLITDKELRTLRGKVEAMGLDPVYMQYDGGHEIVAAQFGSLARGLQEGSI